MTATVVPALLPVAAALVAPPPAPGFQLTDEGSRVRQGGRCEQHVPCR